MQYGFVIDHSRCIGCHACTVACKSENHVPLGKFRTWVKYTEAGAFPQVRRSFAVLRCNQCTDAPCVEICPVNALVKRKDGIVDVDPAACIGCKSCMQGCPYDALYINDDSGTAEKCHFCAHRTELGLAPACAVVCPTEAIIPGDFHDPLSRVSQMRNAGVLTARKVEAGTGPNVWYKEAAPAGLDPSLTNVAGGLLWANQLPGPQLDAQRFEALLTDAERQATGHAIPGADARTTYDVPHPPLWGWMISAYLWTKSIAAGTFLAGALVLPPLGRSPALAGRAGAWIPVLALLFLGLTGALLVGDLKRPERFLYILQRPNWRSWLARGAVILTAYAGLLALWGLAVLLGWGGGGVLGTGLLLVTGAAAAATAAYTAWLFGQAKGRPLFMKRGLAASLLVQAALAGTAFLLLVHPLLGLDVPSADLLRRGLMLALVGQVFGLAVEGRCAPRRREAEYHRALRLIADGPYARRHWWIGVTLGMLVPAVALAFAPWPWAWAAAGALALVGLFVEEDTFVRAGQALPIS